MVRGVRLKIGGPNDVAMTDFGRLEQTFLYCAGNAELMNS
jgi:hypothetical protein